MLARRSVSKTRFFPFPAVDARLDQPFEVERLLWSSHEPEVTSGFIYLFTCSTTCLLFEEKLEGVCVIGSVAEELNGELGLDWMVLLGHPLARCAP